jgi:lysophospholipase L1-like esterase
MVLLALLLSSTLSLALALPQLNILALGDSLTFGCGSDAAPPDWYACCTPSSGGYRAPLWAALNGSAINATIQMVGTESSGPSWMPVEQRAHEGHPGWTISRIQSLQPKWVSVKPDVVLLMAATNDIGQGHSNATMQADMAALLAALRASLPHARILVSSIFWLPQSANLPDLSFTIRAFNAALPALVAATPGAAFVDIAGATGMCFGPSDARSSLCAACNGPCGGYNPAACPPSGYSYCHPSGAGYSLMGGVWAGALLPVLHEVLQAKLHL